MVKSEKTYSKATKTAKTEEDVQVMFYDMRLRCYKRLADITDELYEMNEMILNMKYVHDEELYFRKIHLRITILKEIRGTLQGMLRESVYDARLETLLENLEKKLENATPEELAEGVKNESTK